MSNTTVTGSLNLPYSEFRGPVLMRGTHVRKDVTFDFASFDEAVLMDKSVFSGECSFTGSVFRGPTRFTASTFADGTTFQLAEFGDLGVFELTQFGDPPRLRTRSSVERRLRLCRIHRAIFVQSRQILRYRRLRRSVISVGRRLRLRPFRGRHDLWRDILLAAHLIRVRGSCRPNRLRRRSVQQVCRLHHAQLESADFSGGEKVGGTEFSGPVVFEEATVVNLNLDGAEIDSTLRLPDPRGVGGIQNLRMDPGDVDRIQAVESSRAAGNGDPPYGTRAAREAALALIETAARSGGDLAAADTAEVHRLTLERQDENFVSCGAELGRGMADRRVPGTPAPPVYRPGRRPLLGRAYA